MQCRVQGLRMEVWFLSSVRLQMCSDVYSVFSFHVIILQFTCLANEFLAAIMFGNFCCDFRRRDEICRTHKTRPGYATVVQTSLHNALHPDWLRSVLFDLHNNLVLQRTLIQWNIPFSSDVLTSYCSLLYRNVRHEHHNNSLYAQLHTRARRMSIRPTSAWADWQKIVNDLNDR